MSNCLQMRTQFHIKEAVLVETDMYKFRCSRALAVFLTVGKKLEKLSL